MMEERISLISSHILCVWHPENPLLLLVDLLSTITICSYCYFCGFKMSLIYKREDVNRFENNMLICLNYTPSSKIHLKHTRGLLKTKGVENSTEVEGRWTVLLFMAVTCICQPFDYHNTVSSLREFRFMNV